MTTTTLMRKPKNFGELLTKLNHGKKTGNEYVGDCPCSGHDTPQGHLSLTDAGDKALVKCFPDGRHTYKEICEAWEYDSLVYEAESVKKEWKVTESFVYEIEEGKEHYVIDRQENGEKKKFVIRHKEGAKYVYNKDGIDPILYKLPELRIAIVEGKTILIPEGEGKVDVLRSLGFEATTNPFGAEKWNETYTKVLAGADIVILRDYDKTGGTFANLKAQILKTVAKRVRLPELTDIEEMRAMKGKNGVDVKDWLAAGHTAGELQSIIDATPDWEPPSVLKEEFNRIPNKYVVKNGCHTWMKDIYSKGEIVNTEDVVLCNFKAQIIENVTEDDGLVLTKFYRIVGERYDHKTLESLYIKNTEFKSLGWTSEWCTDIEIVAGQNTQEHLKAAIMAESRKAVWKKIYKHTGWRTINGNRVFLTAAGAIGADDILVDLQHNLGGYDLSNKPNGYHIPKPTGEAADPIKAFKGSLSFLDVASHEVMSRYGRRCTWRR